jgi:hypothetical protein
MARLDRLAEVHAVHVFHEEVEQAVGGLAKVMHADDMRMAQPCQGAGLAGEALGEGRVAAGLRRQDLHRNQAVQTLLPRLVDRAHAAAAEKFDNLQLRELGRKFLDRRRNEAGRRRGGRGLRGRGSPIGRRAAFQPGQHQALRAQTGGRAGRDCTATLGTENGFGHGGFPFMLGPLLFSKGSRRNNVYKS